MHEVDRDSAYTEMSIFMNLSKIYEMCSMKCLKKIQLKQRPLY